MYVLNTRTLFATALLSYYYYYFYYFYFACVYLQMVWRFVLRDIYVRHINEISRLRFGAFIMGTVVSSFRASFLCAIKTLII